jgi:hypothetical protein
MVAASVDQERLEAFVGQAVSDFAATVSSALVVIGDKLGLYKALAEGGPQSPAELGRAHRHRRALPPPVAGQPGGRRLRRPRPGHRSATRCRRSKRRR